MSLTQPFFFYLGRKVRPSAAPHPRVAHRERPHIKIRRPLGWRDGSAVRVLGSLLECHHHRARPAAQHLLPQSARPKTAAGPCDQWPRPNPPHRRRSKTVTPECQNRCNTSQSSPNSVTEAFAETRSNRGCSRTLSDTSQSPMHDVHPAEAASLCDRRCCPA